MPRSLFGRIKKWLQSQKPCHRYLFSRNTSTSNKIPCRNQLGYSWSRVCSALVGNAPIYDQEIALFEASEMLSSGAKPSSYNVVLLIRASTNLGFYSNAQLLHGLVVRSGFGSSVYVSTALINFYLKLEQLRDAHKMFDEIPQPNVVSWNSLISGFVRSGLFSGALRLFLQLERSDLCSDSFSFTAALAACGKLSLLRLGKSIHSKIVRHGAECSPVVANSLIDMYGKCESVEQAINVFNEMTIKDVIAWNSVIAASARNQRLQQAASFLHQMPNPDKISYNELINGFAQFGNIEHAIEILSNMPSPNSSSWNSIITGYVNRNRAREALEFFRKMHCNGMPLDQFTFAIILSGIASLSALKWGIVVHSCTVKGGLDESIVVGSALLDMYSKCGRTKEAESMFHSLPNKNLVCWNAMISCQAHNGNSNKVIQLFEQLKMKKNLAPDGITFLNVLSACWHNKMALEVVNRYFQSMTNDYGIHPTAEHCSCMIRLMGQEGEVWRAETMIKELGFESNGLVWRALLGACGNCGDIKVAEVAAAKIIELEGADNDFVYVLISNIYARQGKWGDVSGIRKLMQKRRVKKEAGYSRIE